MMQLLERSVYAIFPYNADFSVAGVYVGSTRDPRKRILGHIGSHTENQKELHKLMRENGFAYQILGTMKKGESTEYDWIQYFIEKTDFHVFNKERECLNADASRCKNYKFSPIAWNAEEIKGSPRNQGMIYPVLEKEMERKGITQKDLANALIRTPATMCNKLSGNAQLTLAEAFAIQKLIGTRLSIDSLFKEAE